MWFGFNKKSNIPGSNAKHTRYREPIYAVASHENLASSVGNRAFPSDPITDLFAFLKSVLHPPSRCLVWMP